MKIIIYLFVFVLGSCIGSFLNVLIFRIPKHEEFVYGRSHCMSCGHELSWYDMFPIFSFIFLRGKCRYCGAKLSVQYPIIEALNAVLWCLCVHRFGLSMTGILTAALLSSLIVLSVIDERTQEIPFGINIFIAVLGAVKVVSEIIASVTGDTLYFLDGMLMDEYSPFEPVSIQTVSVGHILISHALGFAVVAGVLLLILLISGGAAIGGGDIKLMAAAGLFLGLRLTVIAFFAGCIVGAVIHLIRMAFFHAGKKLAMGPYLAIGIGLMALYGSSMIRAYVAHIL
ncbi:MAG: prepilin peptidase [Candidatus Weimeria sp.]